MTMAKLLVSLPTFASDYTGALSALFGLDGFVVVNNVTFCSENLSGFDEPRWDGSHEAAFSSVMQELDVALGREGRLKEKIIDALKDFAPRFVALLNSPIPMFAGTDIEGIALELAPQIDIPSFGIETTGFDYYDRGIDLAGQRLARCFWGKDGREDRITWPSQVNIVGATPLDFSTNPNLDDLANALLADGYAQIARFPMAANLEEFRMLPQGSVSLVVSRAGLGLARVLERRYGIPWVAGLALGAPDTQGASGLANALDEALISGKSQVIGAAESGEAILFLGEQVQGNSLRQACLDYCEHPLVRVGCIFGQERRLMAPGDIDLPTEKAIREVMNSGYRAIVADPMFKRLLASDSRTEFIDFPLIAVSSRLSWDCTPRFISAESKALVKRLCALAG
jgi:hypothetical protein